jgi:hypothetical protein
MDVRYFAVWEVGGRRQFNQRRESSGKISDSPLEILTLIDMLDHWELSIILRSLT